MPRFLRSKRFLIITGVLVVGAGALLFAGSPEVSDSAVYAHPLRGDFIVPITVSGELRARQFVQITAPANAQQAGAFQMRIQSLVPEGTIVRAGDVVAEIDRSTLATRLTEVTLALQKAEAVFEQAQLDSQLTLGTARENIRTMELGLEEKRLAKDNAVYEAPTVRRQAEIDFERATRALAQARVDYQTRTEQSQAKMREVGADRDRQRNLLNVVQNVMEGFTIRAPGPGMVIYVKEWNGRKRTSGSQVSSWDNAVATLPDLTQMESVTYVNEIDIRKIKVGQRVTISLDSDPSKKLEGQVATVANVGEQRPNQDAKVFEVKVTVLSADTTLRPGMTTGNEIETEKVTNALYVPLEAVSSGDSVTYVFKQNGSRLVRQEVVAGAMNDHEVVIVHGLEIDDRVLLVPPADGSNVPLERLPENLRPVPADTAATARDTGASSRRPPAASQPRATAPPTGSAAPVAPRH